MNASTKSRCTNVTATSSISRELDLGIISRLPTTTPCDAKVDGNVFLIKLEYTISYNNIT